jgi:hypothetical protein
MKDQAYEDEVAAYSDDELNEAIYDAEAEIEDLAGYELAKKFDCPSYDLESAKIRLVTLRAKKNRREVSPV